MMKISLRIFEQQDSEALYNLCKDVSLKSQWDQAYVYPNTEANASKCIRFYREADSYRFYIRAIFCDEQLCGYIQLEYKAYGCGELSYWLGEAWRKQGIMHQAIQQMCTLVFQTSYIVSIYARVDMENKSSQRVLKQLQFDEVIDMCPVYMYFMHKSMFRKNE